MNGVIFKMMGIKMMMVVMVVIFMVMLVIIMMLVPVMTKFNHRNSISIFFKTTWHDECFPQIYHGG